MPSICDIFILIQSAILSPIDQDLAKLRIPPPNFLYLFIADSHHDGHQDFFKMDTSPTSTVGDKHTMNDVGAGSRSSPTIPLSNIANNEEEDENLRPEESDEDEYLVTKTRLALITVALFLTVFLTALDQTIIATAIPKITDEFKALDDIAWYGSA